MRKSYHLAIPILACVALVLVGASGANAESSSSEDCVKISRTDPACVHASDLPPGWTLEKQEALLPWVAAVNEAVGSDPGFADLGVDYDPLTIRVYFSGHTPSAGAGLVGQAARVGVRIRWVPVARGGEALKRAGDQVGASLVEAGIQWERIGADLAASSLTVAVTAESEASVGKDAILEVARAAAPDVPVDVTITEGVEAVKAAETRNNDTSPVTGGARIYVEYSGGRFSKCSTGFSMYSPNGTKYITTAAHCGQYSNNRNVYFGMKNSQGNPSVFLGTTGWTNALFREALLDVALITVPANEPYVYSGTWQGSSKVRVSAAAPFGEQLLACTSGATMGTSCGVQRRAGNVTYHNYPTMDWIFDAERWVNGVKVPVIALGDSGGAVYYQNANGTVTATATMTEGVIMKDRPDIGESSVPCPTGQYDPSTSGTCFITGGFTPFNRVLTKLSTYGSIAVYLTK